MTGTTPYQVMPALAPDEFEALKADIAARGVQVPVEYDEMGNILDGHHRVQACHDLQITHWPRLVRHGMTEAEKRRHARRLNLDRRHLNGEQKRSLIAAELKENPASSDRAIGAGLNVDHKTVGVVREALETTGEIPQLEERQGRDKRTRRITQFVPSTPEEERGLKLSAQELNARNGEQQRIARRDLAAALSSAALDLKGERQYPAIYFDPPWRRKQGLTDRSYENHYPTMTWDEIINWARSMRDRLLPDAWGFMWIPRAHLLALHPVEYQIASDDGSTHTVAVPTPLSWAVARAMGFDAYSTCLVWTKTDEEYPDDIGSGILVRDQDELLLMFKKGRGLPKPRSDEIFGSNHRERSRPLGHSRKPQAYRYMIARMVGADRDGKPLPVLECFARHDGAFPLPESWDSWGNEAQAATNSAEAAE